MGASGALDGPGSHLHSLLTLTNAAGSGPSAELWECVCACVHVYTHVWAGQPGRAAEGIPGLPAALAHTGWVSLLMSFSRPSGVLWRLNQGRVVSKWRNGGLDLLMGQSEPWGPHSEGGKCALIPGDAKPATGERSAHEQVSGGARAQCKEGLMLGGGTVLLGVEATDSGPLGLGETGPQAELGESPAEPQGGGECRVGRRAPSGFYSVTVSRGVVGVWGSCLGWVQSITGLLQFPLL